MATYLNYPFDPELFSYNWQNEKDLTLTNILTSGAIVDSADLKALISNGGDLFTLPFYKVIGGTPGNYDGATDVPVADPQGGSQSGIVFGRTQGWKEKDFIVDYNSGADPMKQITSQVAKFWDKQRQSIIISILKGIFGVAAFADHKKDIGSSSTTVADANKLSDTTIGDATVDVFGDNADCIALAIMHSRVAANLANKNLLNYWKYTDAQGIERKLRIADINGITVLINDNVPHTAATESAAATYTTYLLGMGALLHAVAPVEVPSEVERNAITGGGQNVLITRIREAYHPNGFTFTKPAGYTASPTNAMFEASANWSVAASDDRNIAIMEIISNG